MLLSHRLKTTCDVDIEWFPNIFYRFLVASADLYCLHERELQREIEREIAELPSLRQQLTEDFGLDWRR